jgi:hypothetical protein
LVSGQLSVELPAVRSPVGRRAKRTICPGKITIAIGREKRAKNPAGSRAFLKKVSRGLRPNRRDGVRS